MSTGLDRRRCWALFDQETGLGLTARRHPELLLAAGAVARRRQGRHQPCRTARPRADDAALSAWLGRPVALRAAEVRGPRRYENPDAEDRRSWEVFGALRGPSTTASP